MSIETKITSLDLENIKRIKAVQITPTSSGLTIVGGKTGTTDEAGYCLILMEKDSSDNPYISIVMGASEKPVLYEDMTSLIEAIPSGQQ